MSRFLHSIISTATSVVFTLVSCAPTPLETRAQTYQRERAEFETSCLAQKPIPPECLMPFYIQRFHKRWIELIGKVPASEELWAEHERMARTWAEEFVRFHKEGRPIQPPEKWKKWAEETEQRFALDIAQQLADQEQDAQLRREQAIAALVALGLLAVNTAAAIAQARMAQPQVVPPARSTLPAPSVSRPVFPSLPPLETCTYRLNALQGRMLCVDDYGNVRAR